VLCDRLLRTRLLRNGSFWLYMAVMFVFMFLVNGYLTWRPVVMYGRSFFLGLRVFSIPLEDFLYGFSLIALTIILWEHFRGAPRSDRDPGRS
jgi:lycopene cyclase domain-containing protein